MSKGKTKFIRKAKSDNFTIIDNVFLRRSDMTARSKGLLTYLLALPDDWVVYKGEIFTNHKEGYHALNTAFNELKDLGYINHYSLRNKKGQIDKWVCEIYESPIGNIEYQEKLKSISNPVCDNQKVDNPNVANPIEDDRIQVNHDLLNTNNTNNLNKPKEEDDDIKEGLEKIISRKIKSQLQNAGIINLTETKLLPIARSMQKLISIQHRTPEEAEEIILLAIEIYELNNGRSLLYLTTILADWYDKGLYTVQEVRKYIKSFGNKRTENLEMDSDPVPMINWLKDLSNQS